MGVRYVIAALSVEPKRLDHAARLVLVALAARALDSDRGNKVGGVYFGGRNRVLGDLAILPTRTTLRQLARHLQTLERLGLVERVGRPAPGKQAVYKLCLPVDNPSGRDP